MISHTFSQSSCILEAVDQRLAREEWDGPEPLAGGDWPRIHCHRAYGGN